MWLKTQQQQQKWSSTSSSQPYLKCTIIFHLNYVTLFHLNKIHPIMLSFNWAGISFILCDTFQCQFFFLRYKKTEAWLHKYLTAKNVNTLEKLSFSKCNFGNKTFFTIKQLNSKIISLEIPIITLSMKNSLTFKSVVVKQGAELLGILSMHKLLFSSSEKCFINIHMCERTVTLFTCQI